MKTKEKRATEDERIGWHHRLNGREFEQTLEKVKDSRAWRAAVSGDAESRALRD